MCRNHSAFLRNPLPFETQEEGGQVEAELFVRMLYNGRVIRPSFCQREECPLRTFKSHVLQFLVPQDLEVNSTGFVSSSVLPVLCKV